jgi:4'-phosphopantetheinyl transferase
MDVFITFPDEVDDEDLLAKYDAIMAPEERAIEQRFVFPHDRHRHRVTRALVRTVLGDTLGLKAEELSFELGSHGRPSLGKKHEASSLSFNLSHTKDAIVLAVAREGIVGVDIEDKTRPGATLEIADQFFSPSEVAELRALPLGGQHDRFFQLWTLKEAYIKARGLGLAIPLDSFGFNLDGAEPEVWTNEVCGDDIGRWSFRLLEPTPRHVLAIAVGHPPANLALRLVHTVPLVSQRETNVPVR